MGEHDESRRSRVVMLAWMAAAIATPSLAVLPFLGSLAHGTVSPGVGAVLFVVSLGLPLVFLYVAARAAVSSAFTHGGATVLAVWWLLGLVAAVVIAHQPDAVIWATTLGVINPHANSVWATPGLLVRLGASKTFTVDIPLEALFLMASYTAIKRFRDRETSGKRDVGAQAG